MMRRHVSDHGFQHMVVLAILRFVESSTFAHILSYEMSLFNSSELEYHGPPASWS